MKQNNSEPPLHTLNPLTRFSNRAEDYVKYRPSYPEEAIDIILQGLGKKSQLIAADIGAGTGISSRLLAKRKVNVIAIEPNVAMREAGEPHPKLEFRDGTAEFTKLPENSVDLVTCFQAFHWFDPHSSLREFRRILKSYGRLAVVWNNRDQEDAFTAEYSRLIRVVSDNHPGESRMIRVKPLLESQHFVNIREYEFSYIQKLSLKGLIGRARSASYLPREGALYEQFIADLEKLYQQFCDQDGFVYMAYCTSVHLGDPVE
jgi:SAM-dependent methyltransferase